MRAIRNLLSHEKAPKPLPVVPEVPAATVVTRRDIREMSPADQARVCEAIEVMMDPSWKVGAPYHPPDPSKPLPTGQSEYYRLASYHGWPREFCAHGRETFPGWHRAYLVDFERTLQAADRALGRDGKIGLPYWGWERGYVNGELFPAILRKRFATLKPNLIPPNVDGGEPILRRGYGTVPADAALDQTMKGAKLADQVRRALQQLQHPKAASAQGLNADSVETPHNTIHVLCGWPMTSVDFAAYHPIFFMHHCNVDRLYEAYVQSDVRLISGSNPGPWEEYDKKLFSQPLTPFKHPATGEPFMPVHTFKTAPIGYLYDKLPPIPPQQMREIPTFVLFNDVLPTRLAGRSLALHVFLLPLADTAAFTPPAEVADFFEHPNYGGLNGVFGSKSGECENCKTRDPIDIQVDVTDCLKRLSLSRHTARIEVVAIDMDSEERVQYDNSGMPTPQFAGPFFEDASLLLTRSDAPPSEESVEKGEVMQMQRYLIKYGWYSGEADGFFGPRTEEAVRRFQKFYGLEVDGIAGPKTRGLMLLPRMDDKEDELEVADKATWPVGGVVRWWAGGAPGYLDIEAVRDEVEAALEEWGTAVPLAFKEVEAAEEANLVITWGDRSRDNMFRFDGPGGALAYAQINAAEPGSNGGPSATITIDSSEYWLLQSATGVPPGAFYLLPVLLHEIGHALGLTHSQAPEEVMSSFYVPDRVKLHDGDRERARAVYSLEEGMAGLFTVLDQDKDGLLSREEFLAAVCGGGTAPLQRAEAEALFDQADLSGEGKLRVEEFTVLMSRLYFG